MTLTGSLASESEVSRAVVESDRGRRGRLEAGWPAGWRSRRPAGTIVVEPAEEETGATLMIAIIDYGMGNLRSVQKAIEAVGHAAEVTSDPDGSGAPTR